MEDKVKKFLYIALNTEKLILNLSYDKSEDFEEISYFLVEQNK